MKEYMSELVCGVCAYTGHVTWNGTGRDKRVIYSFTDIQLHPDKPTHFTCLKCGTQQPLS